MLCVSEREEIINSMSVDAYDDISSEMFLIKKGRIFRKHPFLHFLSL